MNSRPLRQECPEFRFHVSGHLRDMGKLSTLELKADYNVRHWSAMTGLARHNCPFWSETLNS